MGTRRPERSTAWERLRRHAELGPLAAYAFAVLCVALAMAARLALDVVAPDVVPFATLFPAVLAAAIVGGPGPGLLALVLGGLAAWRLVLTPQTGFGPLSAGQAASLALYALSSGLVVLVASALRRALDRVRRTDAERDRLASVLEATPDLVSIAEADGRVVYMNRAARRLFGLPPDADLAGRRVPAGHPRWAGDLVVREGLPAALRDGSWSGETSVLAADGREVPLSQLILAHRGGAGGAYLSTIARDVSQERAAREALEAAHRFGAQVIASIVDPFYVVDRAWRFTHVNEAFERLSGKARDELLGRVVWEVFPQAVGGPAHDAILRAVREGRPATFETVSRVVGRWIESTVYPGEFGVAVYVRDITERKEAQERQLLLVAELSHRVKNTLAVVQGIAARSLSGDRTLAEARGAFAKRLGALASAHTLLTKTEWRGAPLRSVLAAELRPYGRKALLDGPDDLELTPKATLTLSLVLHELATNAAKHGALSDADGRVEVAWSLDGPAGDERRLRLLWREVDGPPVSEPLRRGFGRTLIERGWRHDLGGEVALAFRPDGLVCELTAPASTAVVGDPRDCRTPGIGATA